MRNSTWKDTIHKPNPCPYCKTMQNGSLAVLHQRAPKPGDVFFCADCGLPGFYTQDLGRRLPTSEELAEMSSHQEVREAAVLLTFLRAAGQVLGHSKPKNTG